MIATRLAPPPAFRAPHVQDFPARAAAPAAVEDFEHDPLRLEQTQRAILNILEDFATEKERLEGTQKATLNILDDFNAEKLRLEDAQRAVLNILEDAASESGHLAGTQKATLNILDDFNAEKLQLENTQRAALNILEDFDAEKANVERTNLLLKAKTEELNRSNDALQKAHAALEARVEERTADLRQSNLQLRAEMEERRKAEDQVKESLQEKEALLKEIHHRVKNNLQIIQSLLNLQLPQVKDARTVALFKESQDRVYSMALIHEKLYRSESLARLDFGEYIRSLIDHLLLSYGASGKRIRTRIAVENVSLDVDTSIPCALIINELVSNSLKHAFPASVARSEAGEIAVGLRRGADNLMLLSVSDDGIGLPEDFDIQRRETLGLKLVAALSRQLQGSISVGRGGGADFTVSFQAKSKAGAPGGGRQDTDR